MPAAESYRSTVLAIQQEIEAHDLNAAESLLTVAQGRFSKDGGLSNLKGVIAVQREDPERAREAFQQAIHLNPTLVAAYLNLARVDLQFALPSSHSSQREALSLYQKVLVLNPGNGEANIESASLFLATGKADQARVRLQALDSTVQASSRVQALLCGIDASQGNQTEASAVAADLARNADLNEGDVDAALPGLLAGRRADVLDTLLTTVASRMQLSARDERVLGLAQEAENKLEASRGTLEQAYASEPTSTGTLADLARVAVAQGKDQEALGYLAHARELAPRDPALAFSFGVICSRLNLLGEAQKAIGEALVLKPEDPHYLLSMSKVTILSQNSLEASAFLDHYRRLRPEDPEGKLLTGIMYFRAKAFDQAEPWFRKAQESQSTAPAADLYLGSMARQQDRLEQAVDLLQAAAKGEPDDAQAHAELGLALLKLRRYNDAESELDRAVVLDSMSYEANFGLVQLYAHNDDPRRAAQSRRFEEVKDRREEYSRQAMRVIEVQPADAFAKNQ